MTSANGVEIKRRKISAIRDFPDGVRVSNVVNEEFAKGEIVNCAKEESPLKRYDEPKRRRVPVIRHFPGGCVRKTRKAAMEEAVVDGPKDVLDVGEVCGEDNLMENVDAENNNFVVDGVVGQENNVRMGFGEKINEKKVDESSDNCPKMNDLDAEANNLQGEGIVKSSVIKSMWSIILPTCDELEGKSMVKSSKANNLEGNIMGKLSKVEGGATIISPESNNVQGEAMVKLSDSNNLEGQVTDELAEAKILVRKAMVISPNPTTLDNEGMMGESSKTNTLDEEGTVMLSNVNVDFSKHNSLDGESIVKSPKANALNEKSCTNNLELNYFERDTMIDAESKPMSPKLQIVKEVDIIGSTDLEVKSSNINQIEDKHDTPTNKARVASPLTSNNPSEDIVDEHYEKMTHMKGHGAKQAQKSHQVKQVLNTSQKSLRKKHAVKLIQASNNSISTRTRLAVKIDDKNDVLKEDSMEASGDMLLVQALMKAENCPWKNSRYSAGSTSRSVKPKSNAKNKQKSRSTSLPLEGIDDVQDSPPQDDDENDVNIYAQRSEELSITLPSCVPPNSEGASARSMVKRSLRLFQMLTRKIMQEEAKSNDHSKSERVDLRAVAVVKNSDNFVNCGNSIIGNVPGVEVGDEFHFRVELSIVGIHRPYQSGIDYIKRDNGEILATSIVASGGYHDDINSSDVLIYSGSGDKKADQKLVRGNLALKNSVAAKTPVRVVYGFKEQAKGTKTVLTYTYDGLYIVEKYWDEKGSNGFSVFKFQLRRIPGQPEIAIKLVNIAKKSKVREGLIMEDISNGKEAIPICVINTIDNEHPIPFNYTTEVIYPSSFIKKPPRGCGCIKRCHDSGGCDCATKNGGDIPFNDDGAIVQAQTLVYECGPLCRCPPSCPNRVSQRGIKIPLEIFKTENRGWGVRSLHSIPSGSFICEYIGEMLPDEEAEKRSNDEYLFDIGKNYDDPVLWEGLRNPVNETVESEDGFTIDAAEYGNVGRFINHHCSPNLYAQSVLYDHDDKRIPHIMLFAADNIPPLQELTYHYNYCIDQVRDANGNIKRKDCFCGASDCTGRLY